MNCKSQVVLSVAKPTASTLRMRRRLLQLLSAHLKNELAVDAEAETRMSRLVICMVYTFLAVAAL